MLKLIKFMNFIDLVKKYSPKLNDNVSKKKDVWKMISSEFMAKGFNLGDKEKVPDKVANKWNNLMKQYKEFIKETEKTGCGADIWESKPKYFNEIRDILGKHRV